MIDSMCPFPSWPPIVRSPSVPLAAHIGLQILLEEVESMSTLANQRVRLKYTQHCPHSRVRMWSFRGQRRVEHGWWLATWLLFLDELGTMPIDDISNPIPKCVSQESNTDQL